MEDSHKIKMNTMPSQPCSFDFRIYIDPRRTPVKFSIVCRFGIVATILSVSEHRIYQCHSFGSFSDFEQKRAMFEV